MMGKVVFVMDLRKIGVKDVPLYATAPVDGQGHVRWADTRLYVDNTGLKTMGKEPVAENLLGKVAVSEEDGARLSSNSVFGTTPDTDGRKRAVAVFRGDLQPYGGNDSVTFVPGSVRKGECSFVFADEFLAENDTLCRVAGREHTPRMEDVPYPLTTAMVEYADMVAETSANPDVTFDDWARDVSDKVHAYAEHVNAPSLDTAKALYARTGDDSLEHAPLSVLKEYASLQALGLANDKRGVPFCPDEDLRGLAKGCVADMANRYGDVMAAHRKVGAFYETVQAKQPVPEVSDGQFLKQLGSHAAFSEFVDRHMEMFAGDLSAATDDFAEELMRPHSEVVFGSVSAFEFLHEGYVANACEDILRADGNDMPDVLSSLRDGDMVLDAAMYNGYDMADTLEVGDVETVFDVAQVRCRRMGFSQMLGFYSSLPGTESGLDDEDYYLSNSEYQSSLLADAVHWVYEQSGREELNGTSAGEILRDLQTDAYSVLSTVQSVRDDWNKTMYPVVTDVKEAFAEAEPDKGTSRELPSRFEQLLDTERTEEQEQLGE